MNLFQKDKIFLSRDDYFILSSQLLSFILFIYFLRDFVNKHHYWKSSHTWRDKQDNHAKRCNMKKEFRNRRTKKKVNCDIVLLLFNFYSLWHRHQTIHAKIFTCLTWKKNLNKQEKSFIFNFIATKIVVDKLTLTRRFDVYALLLLLFLISNTKNRLRDKSNERVFKLLQALFNQRELS